MQEKGREKFKVAYIACSKKSLQKDFLSKTSPYVVISVNAIQKFCVPKNSYKNMCLQEQRHDNDTYLQPSSQYIAKNVQS